MIEFVRGNLLESRAEAIVNAVNTVGVMGKGIALQFKEMFPHNFREYKKSCESKSLKPGVLLVVNDKHPVVGDKTIINFPTKVHWRNPSQIEYIDSGLKELRKIIAETRLKSIAIPALGCGAGGLKWEDVKPMIQQYLEDVEADILVYEPL